MCIRALPLDSSIHRDRENSALWAQAADGSSHNRAYYVQNYLGGRGDVVAILSSSGTVSQQVRYSAYGVPHGMPAGDTDFNGSIVGTPDVTQMLAWTSSPYTVRGDFDLDGDVDNDDVNIVSSNFGKSVGWGKLSVGPNDTLTGFVGGFRKGYCGYEHDGTNPKIMHVRHRAYLADLGRWTRRDPLGYVDGGNLYEYCQSRPITDTDHLGLSTCVGDAIAAALTGTACFAGVGGCMSGNPAACWFAAGACSGFLGSVLDAIQSCGTNAQVPTWLHIIDDVCNVTEAATTCIGGYGLARQGCRVVYGNWEKRLAQAWNANPLD